MYNLAARPCRAKRSITVEVNSPPNLRVLQNYGIAGSVLTVAALYGAVKKILRLDRNWMGDNGRSPCAVAQGDRPNGRSLGTVGRGPGGIESGGVGVDTDQIGRRAEEAI